MKEYKLECVEHATCARNHSSLTWRCACDRGEIFFNFPIFLDLKDVFFQVI